MKNLVIVAVVWFVSLLIACGGTQNQVQASASSSQEEDDEQTALAQIGMPITIHQEQGMIVTVLCFACPSQDECDNTVDADIGSELVAKMCESHQGTTIGLMRRKQARVGEASCYMHLIPVDGVMCSQ